MRERPKSSLIDFENPSKKLLKNSSLDISTDEEDLKEIEQIPTQYYGLHKKTKIKTHSDSIQSSISISKLSSDSINKEKIFEPIKKRNNTVSSDNSESDNSENDKLKEYGTTIEHWKTMIDFAFERKFPKKLFLIGE